MSEALADQRGMAATLRSAGENAEMTSKLAFLVAALCAAIGLSVQDAKALIITSGCSVDGVDSCTLAELQSGGSISINGVFFANFSGVDADAADDVFVVPTVSGGRVGLRFAPDPNNNPWEVATNGAPGSALFEYRLRYQVFGYLNAASMSAMFFGDAAECFLCGPTVAKFLNDSGEPVLQAGCTVDATNDCNVTTPSQSYRFQPTIALSVTDRITGVIFNPNEPTSPHVLGVRSLHQEFTKVPEPGSLVLLGIGAVAVATCRRKRKPS